MRRPGMQPHWWEFYEDLTCANALKQGRTRWSRKLLAQQIWMHGERPILCSRMDFGSCLEMWLGSA